MIRDLLEGPLSQQAWEAGKLQLLSVVPGDFAPKGSQKAQPHDRERRYEKKDAPASSIRARALLAPELIAHGEDDLTQIITLHTTHESFPPHRSTIIL